jgi:hypothetical protein
MKTAMELALARIEMLYIEKDSVNWEMFKNDCMEKEKEQIIDAYVKGFDISAEGWNGEYGIKDFNNIKEEIKAEQYYNQTYNQNK